jgi:hypothetical protein
MGLRKENHNRGSKLQDTGCGVIESDKKCSVLGCQQQSLFQTFNVVINTQYTYFTQHFSVYFLMQSCLLYRSFTTENTFKTYTH